MAGKEGAYGISRCRSRCSGAFRDSDNYYNAHNYPYCGGKRGDADAHSSEREVDAAGMSCMTNTQDFNTTRMR